MDFRLIPFDHSAWATQTLLRACASLSPQQLDQPFEIGPGSVRETFLHLLGCEMYWTDRMRQTPHRADPAKAHPAATVQQLTELVRASAEDFKQLALSLIQSNRVGETVTTTSGPKGHPIRMASIITHVLHHNAHHRAQILNMLRHLGIRPLPTIDVDDWEKSLLASKP